MNHFPLPRRGEKTRVPMNEVLNRPVLRRAGWDLLLQRPLPTPEQENGSNEKNDANTSKQ